MVILDWLGYLFLGTTKKGFFPENVDRESIVNSLKSLQTRWNLVLLTTLPFQWDERTIPMDETWLKRFDGLDKATSAFWKLEPWGLNEGRHGETGEEEEKREREKWLVAWVKEDISSVCLSCLRSPQEKSSPIRLLYDQKAGFYSRWDRSVGT